MLFKEYPGIKVSFTLVKGLRNIFNTAKSIEIASTKLAHWYNHKVKTGFRAFNSLANTTPKP
ncbi:hypothetical protein [Polaribacter sp.]|uniref:hypothetical protein n=1 Tax=Polaribacter sp. TaxID=1920175 RepID=UPI003F6C516C